MWYNKLMVNKAATKKSTKTKTTKLVDKSTSTRTTRKAAKPQARKFPAGIIVETLLIIVAVVGVVFLFIFNNNKPADYIVETNAFFAPFEFYEGREIKGVDVEIINRVAKRLSKKIDIKDVEFDVIIDNVAAGKIADAGAAGLTITPARQEKVNFSIPYYNSVQYLIFDRNNPPEIRNGHVVWDALRDKKLGTQTGSTGYLFASDEIDNGVLTKSNTELKGFDSHQLAADAIGAKMIDYAIADELPAKLIVSKNANLEALPLYYMGATIGEDYPVEESYAIAVNKEKTELLEAFNAVLAEMLTEDSEGKTEIDRLVLKYMGF